MESLRTAKEMQAWSRQQHSSGLRIGFVPTMGFLHEGHLSLIDLAAEQCDRVVVSIFVNPTQFDRPDDLTSYPRNLDHDLALLEERGVAAVYLPSADTMYPDGFSSWVEVEGLTEVMEGAKRPGHFRGVTTVVSKLFHAVHPDVAAFGQKDAQQATVIQRMCRDLDFGIEILIGETKRESDGLAMSSRNVNLTEDHRVQAPAIHRTLGELRERFHSGERDVETLDSFARDRLTELAPDGRIDALDFADWETLQPVTKIATRTLVAIAVYFGEVRLIDNILLEES